jgi:hypothetical protein
MASLLASRRKEVNLTRVARLLAGPEVSRGFIDV